MAVEFSLYYIVPIMIGLKVSDLDKYLDFIEGRDFYPLIEIANSLSAAIFKGLLENDETYEENSENMKAVTVEEKMKAVYEALFTKNYEMEMAGTNIGSMMFNAGIKDILLRTVGLLSDYTEMDMD